MKSEICTVFESADLRYWHSVEQLVPDLDPHLEYRSGSRYINCVLILKKRNGLLAFLDFFLRREEHLPYFEEVKNDITNFCRMRHLEPDKVVLIK
jgi:hypothetical protein